MNRKILLAAVSVAAVGCIGLGALAAPSIKESVSKLIAGTSMEETLNREVDMGDAFMVANTRPAKTTDPNAQDVYKRQTFFSHLAISSSASFEVGSMAVSYTHLDVYKRQSVRRRSPAGSPARMLAKLCE